MSSARTIKRCWDACGTSFRGDTVPPSEGVDEVGRSEGDASTLEGNVDDSAIDDELSAAVPGEYNDADELDGDRGAESELDCEREGSSVGIHAERAILMFARSQVNPPLLRKLSLRVLFLETAKRRVPRTSM